MPALAKATLSTETNQLNWFVSVDSVVVLFLMCAD